MKGKEEDCRTIIIRRKDLNPNEQELMRYFTTRIICIKILYWLLDCVCVCVLEKMIIGDKCYVIHLGLLS
jgi:hypothetical protein